MFPLEVNGANNIPEEKTADVDKRSLVGLRLYMPILYVVIV
jgi:hypothetical protein